LEIITLPIGELSLPFYLSWGRDAGPLVSSMEESGLIRPPFAYRRWDGGISVFSGRRRIDALRTLGFKETPVVLVFRAEDAKGGDFFKKPGLANPSSELGSEPSSEPSSELSSEDISKDSSKALPDSTGGFRHRDFPGPRPSEESLGLPLSALPGLLRFMAADNMERGFNNAELALMLPWIEISEGEAERASLRKAYGADNPNLYEGALEASGFSPDLALRGLSEGYLDPENLKAAKDWEREEAEALIRIFEKLRPGYQKRRIWIELLSDIRERDKTRVDLLLKDKFFQGLESPKDEEKGRYKLFSLRNPALVAFREKRESLLKSLGVPKGASFRLSDNLEDLSGALNLSFKDPDELEKALESLLKIAKGEEGFRKLWNLPWTDKS
jgi:hypothetical protein